MLNWHQTGQIGGWTTEIVDQSGWFWVGGLFLSNFFILFLFLTKSWEPNPTDHLVSSKLGLHIPTIMVGWMRDLKPSLLIHIRCGMGMLLRKNTLLGGLNLGLQFQKMTWAPLRCLFFIVQCCKRKNNIFFTKICNIYV